MAFKEAEGWKVAQPSDTAPRGNWWEVYEDATLNDLMAQVEVNNFNIALFEARVRQAKAATQGARAALWPIVDLGGGASRNSSNTSVSGRNTNSAYNIQLGASWEPDLWGGIRRNIESAGANAQASEADRGECGSPLALQFAGTTKPKVTGSNPVGRASGRGRNAA